MEDHRLEIDWELLMEAIIYAVKRCRLTWCSDGSISLTYAKEITKLAPENWRKTTSAHFARETRLWRASFDLNKEEDFGYLLLEFSLGHNALLRVSDAGLKIEQIWANPEQEAREQQLYEKFDKFMSGMLDD